MLATPLSRAGTNNRRNVPAKTYETTYTHLYTSFKHRVDLHYVTRELGVRSLALPLSCCSRHTRPHSEQLNVRFAKMGYRCPTCRVTRRTKPNVRGGSCEPCRWLQRQGKPLPHPMISAVAVPTTARRPIGQEISTSLEAVPKKTTNPKIQRHPKGHSSRQSQKIPKRMSQQMSIFFETIPKRPKPIDHEMSTTKPTKTTIQSCSKGHFSRQLQWLGIFGLFLLGLSRRNMLI